MTWTLTLTEVDQQSTSSSFCSDLTSEDERSGVRSECRTEQVYKSVFPYLRGQGVCWDSEHGSGGGGGPGNGCPQTAALVRQEAPSRPRALGGQLTGRGPGRATADARALVAALALVKVIWKRSSQKAAGRGERQGREQGPQTRVCSGIMREAEASSLRPQQSGVGDAPRRVFDQQL